MPPSDSGAPLRANNLPSGEVWGSLLITAPLSNRASRVCSIGKWGYCNRAPVDRIFENHSCSERRGRPHLRETGWPRKVRAAQSARCTLSGAHGAVFSYLVRIVPDPAPISRPEISTFLTQIGRPESSYSVTIRCAPSGPIAGPFASKYSVSVRCLFELY